MFRPEVPHHRRIAASLVLARLSQARWAHFACHGRFDPNDPLRSALYLWDKTPELTLERVLSLNLGAVELLTLAACWSAEAAVLPGNEAICFPAAFLRAGVGAVVAPLWEVHDVVSREFQAAFYERAKEIGPARALAFVQRKWAEAERPAYDWASFRLYAPHLRRRESDAS
jgi:CHAT domain-containing protein